MLGFDWKKNIYLFFNKTHQQPFMRTLHKKHLVFRAVQRGAMFRTMLTKKCIEPLVPPVTAIRTVSHSKNTSLSWLWINLKILKQLHWNYMFLGTKKEKHRNRQNRRQQQKKNISKQNCKHLKIISMSIPTSSCWSCLTVPRRHRSRTFLPIASPDTEANWLQLVWMAQPVGKESQKSPEKHVNQKNHTKKKQKMMGTLRKNDHLV